MMVLEIRLFINLHFITLELKVKKSTEYAISWKSKILYKSKPLPFYGAFLPNIKKIVSKIAMQFNKTFLNTRNCKLLHF